MTHFSRGAHLRRGCTFSHQVFCKDLFQNFRKIHRTITRWRFSSLIENAFFPVYFFQTSYFKEQHFWKVASQVSNEISYHCSLQTSNFQAMLKAFCNTISLCSLTYSDFVCNTFFLHTTAKNWLLEVYLCEDYVL